MKILGLLAFYDEQPEHLVEAIASLADAGISQIIAVDGAYQLYPDAQPASPPDQHEAIIDTAQTKGIGCTLHIPAQPWAGNEIEKRTVMFAIAHALAMPYEDWLWVHDSDEVVIHHNNLPGALEATDKDVCAVLHGEPGVRPRSERRLFRAHPQGIQVKRAHYLYFDGDGRVLWGPGQIDRDLLDVQILHRPRLRTQQRRDNRDVYYEHRLLTRAESESL